MPLRLSTPDNGFATVALPSNDPPTAPPQPDFFQSIPAALDLLMPGIAPKALPSDVQTAGAAYDLDNAVVNAWQYMTKPSFPPDPTFDVQKQLNTDGLWDQYRDNFLNVQSRPEYDYVAGKIAKENNERNVLARAGAPGVILSGAAGLADPTTFLPFIGEGKGPLAILKATLLGGSAAALDEIPLRLNQPTRTNADTAWSIGGGAAMGAILGTGAAFLNRGASIDEGLENVAKDMAGTPGANAISGSAIPDLEQQIATLREQHAAELTTPEIDVPTVQARQAAEIAPLETQLETARTNVANAQTVDQHLAEALKPGAAVGADIVDRDAGGLKNMLGIGERLTKIAGPVTANLGQRVSPIGRQMTAELSTAGLRLERNVILGSERGPDGNYPIIGAVPSNQGGTVESFINSRRGDVLATLNKSYQNYADYVFGAGKSNAPFRNSRAAVVGLSEKRALIGPAPRMNRRDFFRAVGDAMLHDDKHPVPEVQQTAVEHRALYNGLYDEAKQLGIIPEEVNLMGDTSFLNRIYDLQAIARNPVQFQSIIQEHMNGVLQDDLSKIHTTYSGAQAKDRTRLSDMDLPLEDARALEANLRETLKGLDTKENGDAVAVEKLIRETRSAALDKSKQINQLNRQLASGPQDSTTVNTLRGQVATFTTERQTLRDRISQLSSTDGISDRATLRAETKRRLRNLNRNQFFMEDKYRAKFNSIEDLEDANLDSMHRAIGAGQRALQEMDHISDKSQAAVEAASSALDETVDKWVDYGNRIDALKEKNPDASIENPDNEVAKILGLQGKQSDSLDDLLAAQERLNSVKNMDHTEGGVRDARNAVQDGLDATAKKLSELNDRRAQRAARLEKSLDKFDEPAFKAKRDEVVVRMKARTEAVRERVNNLGGDNYDPERGTANFTERAKDIARLASDKVRGTNVRLAGFDAMQDKRGTELARSLSVPSDRFAPYGFLDTDAEHAVHAYANTLIPDIEITRRFGPFAPDGARNQRIIELNEEQQRVSEALDRNTRNPIQPDGTRKAVPLSPKEEAALGEQQAKLSAEYDSIRTNIDAIIRRLRHQWGIPLRPDGYTARGVSIVLGLQALRLLGSVPISSFQDLARPVMKYGLARTMSSAWLPMISNWKAIRMSAAEARRAYVAVETMTADRAHQLTDTINLARRQSKGEAVLHWGVSKIGIVAGFAPWTDLMKTLSTMTFSSKALDSLELSLTKTGNGADRADAIEFLNSLGWSDDIQSRIWNEMQNGGAQKIGGTWIPQTDNWDDKDAVRSFRAATNSEANASIITPGVELPKVANSSLVGRVILNLRSYAMSSTSKTLMAGLQQRDMAVLNGVWTSLALGALSVYLKAQIAGGYNLQEMQSWSPQEWVERSIDAAGILGAVGLAQQYASDATAGPANGTTAPQRALAATRNALGAFSVSDPASAMIDDAFGPTAGLVALVTKAEATGKWTPSEIHSIRELLPLQNVFYLRKLFDVLENSVGGNR